MAWCPVAVWFAPDEPSAERLVADGIPRGRIWTVGELLALLAILDSHRPTPGDSPSPSSRSTACSPTSGPRPRRRRSPSGCRGWPRSLRETRQMADTRRDRLPSCRHVGPCLCAARRRLDQLAQGEPARPPRRSRRSRARPIPVGPAPPRAGGHNTSPPPGWGDGTSSSTRPRHRAGSAPPAAAAGRWTLPVPQGGSAPGQQLRLGGDHVRDVHGHARPSRHWPGRADPVTAPCRSRSGRRQPCP
jgi:hypothetical protein